MEYWLQLNAHGTSFNSVKCFHYVLFRSQSLRARSEVWFIEVTLLSARFEIRIEKL